MAAAFDTIKWFVFALNILCLFFGIGDIYVNVIGVEEALPGTDAHIFSILAILLCSLLCLTTVIGCYGVCSEVFGVTVIYSVFILSLLVIQYIQIRSFQPHDSYFKSLQELESAWRLIETQPKYMDAIQSQFHCCGLYNANDYSYKHLSIPVTCHISSTGVDDGDFKPVVLQVNNIGCLEKMWSYNKFVEHRQFLINWTLVITEFVTFIYSIVLSILILKKRTRPRLENLNGSVAGEFSHQNHFGSRQMLLSSVS